MYSKASYKDQLGQVRNVMADHKNTGGIDETGFKQTEILPERMPIADRSWILPPESLRPTPRWTIG
jgi:hypothetical protein